MSLFVDEKYLNSIGHQLRNFRKKQDYLWNFSCPLCGDSKKKKIKARGYVFRDRDSLKFKCHNCGESMRIGDFIRHIDPSLYKEYVCESFLEKGQAPPKKKDDSEDPTEVVKKFQKKKTYKAAKPTALIGCPSIATLGPDHPARAYLDWRKLPVEALQELYWTDDFPALVDNFLPGHQYSLVKEGRIIIPFFDTKHQLIAMQGRSQPKYNKAEDDWKDAPGAIRYITIKADKDAPRIFGMHKISLVSKERIYCVEGPFDSLFLKNCVAMAGSDIPTGFPRDRTAIVFDNEPRKAQTVKKIENAIAQGFTVCIWPENVHEKDINNMILAGYKPEKVRELIDLSLYSGERAKLELQHWANRKGGSSGKGNASFTNKGHNS
jgi:transcription elongation factor Elf1